MQREDIIISPPLVERCAAPVSGAIWSHHCCGLKPLRCLALWLSRRRTSAPCASRESSERWPVPLGCGRRASSLHTDHQHGGCGDGRLGAFAPERTSPIPPPPRGSGG